MLFRAGVVPPYRRTTTSNLARAESAHRNTGSERCVRRCTEGRSSLQALLERCLDNVVQLKSRTAYISLQTLATLRARASTDNQWLHTREVPKQGSGRWQKHGRRDRKSTRL